MRARETNGQKQKSAERSTLFDYLFHPQTCCGKSIHALELAGLAALLLGVTLYRSGGFALAFPG